VLSAFFFFFFSFSFFPNTPLSKHTTPPLNPFLQTSSSRRGNASASRRPASDDDVPALPRGKASSSRQWRAAEAEEEEDQGYGVRRAAPAYTSSRRSTMTEEDEVQDDYVQRPSGKSAAKPRGNAARYEPEDEYAEADAPPPATTGRRGDRGSFDPHSGSVAKSSSAARSRHAQA
jgi:hypothetical protein